MVPKKKKKKKKKKRNHGPAGGIKITLKFNINVKEYQVKRISVVEHMPRLQGVSGLPGGIWQFYLLRFS